MTEVDKTKALEDSLYNLLLPVAEECNTHINEIAATQKALSDQLDKLVAELERLKALTQCPIAFSPYSKKLISCRNRVDNASRALTSVETRVTKMTVGLSKLQPKVFEAQFQKDANPPARPPKEELPPPKQKDAPEKEESQAKENVEEKKEEPQEPQKPKEEEETK